MTDGPRSGEIVDFSEDGAKNVIARGWGTAFQEGAAPAPPVEEDAAAASAGGSTAPGATSEGKNAKRGGHKRAAAGAADGA